MNGGKGGDELAPVIPLFGSEGAQEPATTDWHATWTDDVAPRALGADGEAAEAALIKRLRGRSLSVREAEALLAEYDIDSGEQALIIENAVASGYLDDARLAEQLVHTAVSRKLQGAQAISRTLATRGIPREQIAAALELLPDDERERALEFARQKARSLEGVEREAALRRLHGQLARRGFSGGLALDAARTALDEISSPRSRVQFR